MNLGRIATTGETVSLTDAERGRHLYAIGKTSVGKTSSAFSIRTATARRGSPTRFRLIASRT
jgi:hypothetical protein